MVFFPLIIPNAGFKISMCFLASLLLNNYDNFLFKNNYKVHGFRLIKRDHFFMLLLTSFEWDLVFRHLGLCLKLALTKNQTIKRVLNLSISLQKYLMNILTIYCNQNKSVLVSLEGGNPKRLRTADWSTFFSRIRSTMPDNGTWLSTSLRSMVRIRPIKFA